MIIGGILESSLLCYCFCCLHRLVFQKREMKTKKKESWLSIGERDRDGNKKERKGNKKLGMS